MSAPENRVMREAPERILASTGYHMDNGKVSKVEIPTQWWSARAEECFGPLWVRADIHEALIAERDALKAEVGKVDRICVEYLKQLADARAEVERLRSELDEGLPSIADVRGILSGMCPTCGYGHSGPCAPQSAAQPASPPPTATETSEPPKPVLSPLRGAAKGDRWA